MYDSGGYRIKYQGRSLVGGWEFELRLKENEGINHVNSGHCRLRK